MDVFIIAKKSWKKFDSLSLIPRTHIKVKVENWLHKDVLWTLHINLGINSHSAYTSWTHMHMIINIKDK